MGSNNVEIDIKIMCNFTSMKKHYIILLLIIIMVALPNLLDAQCAMCKAAVETSEGQKNSVAGGINQGILYLMAVPYIMLAFIFRKQIVSLWRSLRGKSVIEE